jgi:hypothetical protein
MLGQGGTRMTAMVRIVMRIEEDLQYTLLSELIMPV